MRVTSAALHEEQAAAYLHRVQFRVLGPIEYVDGGAADSLGSPKQRAVLALLLKDAGDVVPVDRLIQGVWGDDASRTVRGSLHTYISNLRAIIGGRIERVGNGYRIEVSKDQVDSHLFEQLTDKAQNALTADPAEAGQSLRAALAMWQGRPYADIPDTPGLQEEIRRLEERRLSAVESRIDADLAGGRHQSIIPELEALAEEHPLREGFRARHMVALYRDGQQAEALRAYQRTRTYLAEELGVEPSLELQKIEDSILRHDPVLMSSEDVRTEDLAFLYTDVEGSTLLWETRPDAMREALTLHDQILVESIESAGGRVFKHTGDGMLAAFAATAEAAAAAVSIQKGLASADWGQSGALKVRMAVDAGEVESRGGDYFGPPLNRGARMMDAAHGGQIVVSSEAHDRLMQQVGLQFRSLGEHRFKGLGAPQTVFQLVDPDLPDSFPDLRVHAAPSEAERRFGDSIRGYEIRERIGVGRFAVVYRAYQASVGREVAVKVIRPEYSSHPGFVRRFESEARLVAKLEHPHIVSLYDFWRDPEGAYLVMPWLSGRSLAGSPFGAMSADQVIPIIQQVGSALAYAHRQGVIHRDVKPANLLLDGEGNVYVADFGIAVRSLEKVVGPPSASQIYRAPEDRSGQAVDERSDVYSLGAVAAELLSGTAPPTADHSALSEQIRVVIDRAMSEAPDDRHHSIDEFVDALADAAGQPTEEARVLPVVVRNPYKGLAAFTEADAADFFGRDAELESLLRLVEDHRLATVVGPSGSGKSSLVRAGLVPALRKGQLTGSDDWLIVTTIPGAHPFDELATALLDVATESLGDIAAELRSDEQGLLRVGKRLSRELDTELVIVIDQLEELYSLVADEEGRNQFVDSLVTATQEPRSSVRVLATIRADFFHQPLLHDRFGEIVSGAHLALSVPGPEALQEAIEGPAARAGITLEEGVAEQIVRDVRDEPGGLPLMQYALTALADRSSTGELTLADYQAVGAVTGALTSRAGTVFEDLDEDAQKASQGLFLRLVSVSEDADDVRRRVRRTELESSSTDPAATERALDAFGAARLLTFDSDPITRSPTVEVAHEALLREWELLRTWITDRRELLLARRRLDLALAEWDQADRRPEALPVGNQLAQLEGVAEDATIRLSADEQAFLDAAVARRGQAQRRRRRLRWAITGGFAAAAVVASIFAVQALQNADEARQATETQITNRIASQAPVVFRTDPTLGLLLAVEAYRRADSPVSLGALQRVLVDSRGFLGYVGSSDPDVVYRDLVWIDDGRFLAAHDVGLDVVSTTGDVTLLGFPAGVETLAISPNRHTAAVATTSTVTLIETASGQPNGVELAHAGVISMAFTPDGTQLATGDSDGYVYFWDVATGEQRGEQLLAHPESTFHSFGFEADEVCGPLNHRTDTFRIGAAALSFDSTGQRLVTAGMVAVRAWDMEGLVKTDEVLTRRIGDPDRCPTAALGVHQGSSGDPVKIATNGQVLQWMPGSGVDPSLVGGFDFKNIQLMGAETAVTDVVVDDELVLFAPQAGQLTGARFSSPADRWEFNSQLPGQAYVALSPSGTRVAHAGTGRIAVWSLLGEGPISASAPVGQTAETTVSNSGAVVTIHLGVSPRLFRLTPEGLTEVSAEPLQDWLGAWFRGDYLLGLLDASTPFLVDPNSLEPIHRFELSEGNTAFVADPLPGGRFAIGGVGGRVDVFGPNGGPPITSFPLPDGEVAISIAFSPGADRLGAASGGGAAGIWDLMTEAPVEPFPLSAGGGQVINMEYDPTSGSLVTVDDRGTIVFRDAETLQPDGEPLEGASATTAFGGWGPVFQESGRYMITAFDVVGRLWDIEERVQVGGTFPTDPQTQASASMDGRWLATVVEGDLVLWNLDTTQWAEAACRAAGRNLTAEEWNQFIGEQSPYRVTCPMWESLAEEQGGGGS